MHVFQKALHMTDQKCARTEIRANPTGRAV
jgi:hypothetical protein